MVHRVLGVDTPVDNSNLVNLYSEVVLGAADTEVYMSPGATTAAPNFPSISGEILSVVSDNIGDVGIAVIIEGLDVNFDIITETVTLNGTTLVLTNQSFTRVNDITIVPPGLNKPAGELTVADSTGATKYRGWNNAAGLSIDALYTVPRGKAWTALSIYSSYLKEGGAVSVGFTAIYIRLRAVGFFVRPFRFGVASQGNSSEDYANVLSEEFIGPTDFYMTATSSAANSEMVARLAVHQKD